MTISATSYAERITSWARNTWRLPRRTNIQCRFRHQARQNPRTGKQQRDPVRNSTSSVFRRTRRRHFPSRRGVRRRFSRIQSSELRSASFPLEIPGLDGKLFAARFERRRFEIDNKFITNRPDLFSVEGNAREFSTLSTFLSGVTKSGTPQGFLLEVKIESDRVLAAQLSVSVKNVSAKESPFAIRPPRTCRRES